MKTDYNSSRENIKSSNRCNVFRDLFGFYASDFSSWNRFVCLLFRPTDHANLGCFRFLFGFLMIIDTLNERGMLSIDQRWADEEKCHFPLLYFLQPPPMRWIWLLYLFMLTGAVGIMFGAFYRMSCLMYLLSYWYIFLLEKTLWNNHSYLFGILAFLLMLSDANSYLSVDCFCVNGQNISHVPLWNYALLRAQVFLVYFIAGLKKLDYDWINGYSMSNLSSHWIFHPFKLLLTDVQVDDVVVHLGGLTIDLSVSFLLFFNRTRVFGIVLCSSFHLVNSQLFAIGVFPWMMLAAMPLFFDADWPQRAFRIMCNINWSANFLMIQLHSVFHCFLSRDVMESNSTATCCDNVGKEKATSRALSCRHHITAVFCIVFVSWQICLPYSHSITKGYNSWTDGLYGYSWDMMVHSWSIQHITVVYMDKESKQRGYLKPDLWTNNFRWASRPDMIKQYATCIAHNMLVYNASNIELYFDIWISLNKRFHQRAVDPSVNMVTAEWNIFQPTQWMMPLLDQLSDWRGQLADIEKSLHTTSDQMDVVFISDFPGLHLENFVHEDLGNTTISVLQGELVLEIMSDVDGVSPPANITLLAGQAAQVPAGKFHTVYTVSKEPSCFMYIYVNTTELTT